MSVAVGVVSIAAGGVVTATGGGGVVSVTGGLVIRDDDDCLETFCLMVIFKAANSCTLFAISSKKWNI